MEGEGQEEAEEDFNAVEVEGGRQDEAVEEVEEVLQEEVAVVVSVEVVVILVEVVVVMVEGEVVMVEVEVVTVVVVEAAAGFVVVVVVVAVVVVDSEVHSKNTHNLPYLQSELFCSCNSKSQWLAMRLQFYPNLREYTIENFYCTFQKQPSLHRSRYLHS